MDGMVSQDEINALLSGMDLSGDEAPDMSGIELPAKEEMPPTDPYLINSQPVTGGDELLDDVEKDAIGEVANISMGSSATTLYSLVNRKVNITYILYFFGDVFKFFGFFLTFCNISFNCVFKRCNVNFQQRFINCSFG